MSQVNEPSITLLLDLSPVILREYRDQVTQFRMTEGFKREFIRRLNWGNHLA
jgi:hypothetical protein